MLVNRKKIFIPLGLLVLIFGCSHNKHHREVNRHGERVNQETLARIPLGELNQFNQESGIHLCHRGEVKKGLKLLKQEMELKKGNAQYWNQVGTCYFIDREYNEALLYYKIGLSLDSKNYEIYNNIGLLYAKKENYLKSVQFIEKALSLNKQSIVVRYNLASIHFNFSNYNRSIELVHSVYSQASLDPDLNLLLGKNYLHLGNYQQANRYFARIPETYQEDHEIANYYAFSLARVKKFDQANEILKKSGIPGRRIQKKFKQKLLSLINEKALKEGAVSKVHNNLVKRK
jgi:Flp pilus assembly protein TadD